jgi:hypothetical protein
MRLKVIIKISGVSSDDGGRYSGNIWTMIKLFFQHYLGAELKV